jgi:hypothetical protein
MYLSYLFGHSNAPLQYRPIILRLVCNIDFVSSDLHIASAQSDLEDDGGFSSDFVLLVFHFSQTYDHKILSVIIMRNAYSILFICWLLLSI